MKKKFEHERNDKGKIECVFSMEVSKIEWVTRNFMG